MPRTSQAPARTGRPSGFTLIELLVVVSIVVLLIGILIPTLGAVRTAARKTQTQAMATQLVNAMAAFKADKRRLPGYFNVSEMASSTNWAGLSAASGEPGFTETENVLLELAGGILPGETFDPQRRIYSVGPTEDPTRDVVISQDSARSAAATGYLKMDSDSLFAVAGQSGLPGERGSESEEFGEDRPSNYIEVMDPFGMPMLVWKRNLSAKRTNTSAPYQLAAINYDDAQNSNASFYWATNAGYLSAARLGDDAVNQRQDTGVKNPSLIGGGEGDAGNVLLSLVSILGNPGFASADGDMRDELLNSPEASDFARPEAFRGDVIVMSAGADKVYFGKKQDPGISEGDSPDRGKHVGFVMLNTESTPTTPIPGTAEADRFDDVVVSGG